jgi:hypothetical protein
VPCFGIVGRNDLDAFGARLLDIQRISEAHDLAEIEAAAAALAELV